MFIVYHCLSRFGISTTVIHDEFMIFLTVNSRVVLVWSFFSFSTIPSNSHRGWEIRKVLCWIRNRESLIVDKKTWKSYLGKDNLKVLSWIRNPKSLILHERIQKSFISWGNWIICPMSSQFLPNVCPISAKCSKCLPNVPKFCPMSSAVKSRISSNMFIWIIKNEAKISLHNYYIFWEKPTHTVI